MPRHASFWETHHNLWSNITGFPECKMDNFVQKKSQATKALEDRKEDNLIPNYS